MPIIKDVRAQYHRGKLVPLQPLDIKEGEVVTIRVEIDTPEEHAERVKRRREILKETAGGWIGLVDRDKLLKDIYEARAAGIELPPEN